MAGLPALIEALHITTTSLEVAGFPALINCMDLASVIKVEALAALALHTGFKLLYIDLPVQYMQTILIFLLHICSGMRSASDLLN